MTTTPIGDPRQSGEEGPAGDQRKAGETGTAGDPRPAGQANVTAVKDSSDETSDSKPKPTKKAAAKKS